MVAKNKCAEDKLGNQCIDIINNSEEWWTKKIGLSTFTGMLTPPSIPKPRDPSLPPVKKSDIVKGLMDKYGFTNHMSNIYIEAAEDGNVEAILKCNTAIGQEYYTK